MINNTENNTLGNTESKGARIQYGFTLNFPDRFTIKSLSDSCNGKVKYITLYSRVKKAIREGVVVEDRLQVPSNKVRGRRKMIYVRTDAKSVCEPVFDAAMKQSENRLVAEIPQRDQFDGCNQSDWISREESKLGNLVKKIRSGFHAFRI